MKHYGVLVCGTNFGKFYISALMKSNPCFFLAGILAKGSRRSRHIASELGVPLYTDVHEVPESVNIACVVLKSTILGGQGTRVALELLKKGIHVIQEHPVHPGDIGQCLTVAAENRCHYHVNSHFVHVKPVKTFIEYVSKTIRTERPLFIDACTSLIYSTLDIIGRALGGLEPYGINPPVVWSDAVLSVMGTEVLPYKCIQGVIGGVPVTFKLQNYFDPDDVDQNYLIMHRLCIGSESGNTTLLSSHGPVVWTQGYPMPVKPPGDAVVLDSGDESFKGHMSRYTHYSQPTSVVFSQQKGPSYRAVTQDLWPEAMLRALGAMKQQIETGRVSTWQSEDYLRSLSGLWLAFMKGFGKPDFVPIAEVDSCIPDPSAFADSLEG